MKKVKILFIEDNEDDFALILREFKKAPFEFEYVLVENAKSFEKEIEKKWDIVISDYSLPGFTGFEALRLCNKKGIDTPFIVVSGTVGEDIAVDMMKSGAKDYIMKKDLARLLPAVERELTDAKIRKKNKYIALEREVLFTISRDIMVASDLDELLNKIYNNIKKVIYAENCFIALYTSEKDEIYFPFFVDKHDTKPAPMKKRKSLTDYVLQTGKSLICDEIEFKKISKKFGIEEIGTSSVSWLGVPLFIKTKPIGVLVVQSYEKDIVYNENDKNFLEAIANDIALAIERKISEDALRESEYRFKILAEAAPVGIFRTDENGITNYVNPRWCEISKMKFDDAMGDGWLNSVHPEDKEMLALNWQKAVLSKSESYAEYRFIHPDGSIAWVIGRAVPQGDENGKILGYIGTTTDITERKHSEEALRKSEERYRVFINSTSDMAFLKDENYKYILVNKANADYFGKRVDEIIGKTDFDFMPDFAAKNCRKSDKEAMNSDNVVVNEEQIENRFYETHKFRVPLSEGKYGVGGYVRDITERKWAEDNLRKSEEHYRTLLKAIPDIMFRIDGKGRIIDYHVDDLSVLFAPPEKFLGKQYNTILPKYVSDKLSNSIKKVIRTGEIEVFDYEMNIGNNNLFFEARITSYEEGIIAIIRDITEQKNAEKALLVSENKYRTIFENVQDIFYQTNIDGIVTEISPSVEKYGGFKREDLIGKSADIFYQNPDDRENFLNEINKNGKVSDFEIKLKTKDGNIRSSSVSAHLIFDAEGKPCGIEGVLRDISERKKSEEALKVSEERYRVLIESMSEGVLSSDINDVLIFANKRALDIFGYSSEELIGKAGYDIFLIEEDRHIVQEKTKLRNKVESDSYIVRGRKKSGEVIWLNVNGAAIKDDKDNIIGTVGIINDITKSRESEIALTESEERYRKIFEESPFGIVLVDSDLRFIKINSEYCRMTGYSETELMSKTFKDITHPEHIEQDIHNIKKLIKGEIQIYNTEKRYIKKDGSIAWGELSVSIVKNYDGKFLYLLGMIEDITARKFAEEAVKESEEHFRNIVRNAEAAYFRINKEGLFEEVNKSWLKIHKYSSPDEIIGKHFSVTQVDVDINLANALVNELMEGKPIETGEISRKCKDGSIGYHTFSINPVIKKGQVVGIEGFLIDITEQKTSLQALKESQERYKILIETMNEGITMVDNDDIIQFVNRRECEIFGYEPEELIGQNGNELLIIEEDRHIIIEKNKARENFISDSYQIRGKKKSGEVIWLNINGAPVKNKEGIVTGSVGLISDITERKNAEEDLIKLSSAVQQSPASIVITDLKGNIEYVNPKFVDVTGYIPEEIVGRNPRILKSGEKPSEEYKELWDTITSGKDWFGEFHNKKKNGELYWEHASISPIRNAEGKFTHFLAVKEDITDKKEKELELIKAKEKAEESERLKSSFLANMSHELRTPMVGILGFAELIKSVAENIELQDFADNISKSGKRLLETLNLILDLSRIEAGRFEVKTGEVNIVKLAAEVYTNYLNEADKKNIKLSFKNSEDVIIAKIDERMIFESINNLVNNAFKYTKSGEIKIEVNSDISNGIAKIKISDTGIGIEKENLKVIFEEFRQASEGYSRSFEGTGLGLTITKNFIEKNGGTILVESEIGVGTAFTIELPLINAGKKSESEKETKETEENISAKISKNISILCVDDDSFTREYLEYILREKYVLSFVENGTSAIETSKSKKFSLILMDINLGKGMDGIEAARKIRKLPGYKNIPVIAMTAFAMIGDKEEFINAGMSDYISKPFKAIELINLIEGVLKK